MRQIYMQETLQNLQENVQKIDAFRSVFLHRNLTHLKCFLRIKLTRFAAFFFSYKFDAFRRVFVTRFL